jgi:fructose-1,6-bisphosphatase/inositol monophosphatase family enzyme
MISTQELEEVVAILRDAATRFVLPHATQRPDAIEKSPGEVVTRVDVEAEAFLTKALTEIEPIRVIGEEAAGKDPAIGNGLATDSYWLIDALDGTANFASGSNNYAMMIALVIGGDAAASWIYRPAEDVMYVAIKNGGATRNGEPIRCTTNPKSTSELRGAVLTRFLPEATTQAVASNSSRFGFIGAGTKCAGVDYPGLIEGKGDFIVYWRVLPWDHTPGVLLIEEAGGYVQRPDGSKYRPSMTEAGLLVATSAHVIEQVRTTLLELT